MTHNLEDTGRHIRRVAGENHEMWKKPSFKAASRRAFRSLGQPSHLFLLVDMLGTEGRIVCIEGCSEMTRFPRWLTPGRSELRE